MMIGAIGAAALLGMAANMGATDVAQAVPVPSGSLQTLSAGGGADFVDIAPYVGRGLSTRDGSVDGGAGGNDAYDFAHNLLVDGNVYQPGTADLTGQTYSGGTASISGLDVTTTFSAAGDQGPRAEYELSVDPGATVSLLWFNSLTDSRLGLTGGVSAATALIADLDNLASGNPRLAGLSDTQLAQVANFQFGAQTVPEPGTLTMIGAGLLGIGWLRRRRRR